MKGCTAGVENRYLRNTLRIRPFRRKYGLRGTSAANDIARRAAALISHPPCPSVICLRISHSFTLRATHCWKTQVREVQCEGNEEFPPPFYEPSRPPVRTLFRLPPRSRASPGHDLLRRQCRKQCKCRYGFWTSFCLLSRNGWMR